jgi:hypothetical protein
MKRSLCALILGVFPLAAQVKITPAPDRIAVDIGGKPFTTLFIGPETTKPYLHPLRAASGAIVTRGFPMEPREGESRDHIHQRGLWFTHGDVNGFDFWGNDPSQQGPKKGRITLNKVLAVKSGSKSGSLKAAFDWLDAPIMQVATEDVPLPYSGRLELEAIPTEQDIVNAALEVVYRD